MNSALRERIAHNQRQSSDIWTRLVAQYGYQRVTGGTEKRYAESGKEEWLRAKTLIDTACVLEYGAGAGRIAGAASPDCGKLFLWEPCEALRGMLQDVPNAEVLDELPKTFTPRLSSIMCINVINHLSYEELWAFVEYSASFPGIDVLVHYRQNWGKRCCVFHQGIASEWPIYLWTPDLIAKLFLAAGGHLRKRDAGNWNMDVYRIGGKR